jgi:hypothetical protein
VWRATPELIVALDGRFGEPIDAYVNGSQVWLRDDGPGGMAIEWRLHPVAGYRRPAGLATDDVFATVALSLATGQPPAARLDQLWDGLEAFPAYGHDVEPVPLAAAVTESLGIAPDAAGLVDHTPIGDEWERRQGGVSIVNALLRQLERYPADDLGPGSAGSGGSAGSAGSGDE